MLVGQRVLLRQPKRSDVKDRIRLGRNLEITRLYGGSLEEARQPLIVSDVAAWLETLKEHSCAWIVEHEGRLLGEIKLHAINEDDRRARLAIGLYDPEKLGIGLGTEAVRLVARYAFDGMKLHRIDLRVLAFNARAIASYQKCGFKIEGRERESAFVDGRWEDDFMMGLLESDFIDA